MHIYLWFYQKCTWGVRQNSAAPWALTAWDHAEAHCVPMIGGWGAGLLPLMEFNDCSMSEEEAGGSVSYEVWVPPHSSATIIAALQRHWLLIDSPTVDVREPQPRRLRVMGRGHRNWQTFMGDDSLQISQSVQRHSGWQWGLPWNWRSQQPAFISSGLFFPPRGAIAWQREVTECVKTPTRTHSAWIRDSNGKVFSKRQKNKLISFSKIWSNHFSITHISALMQEVLLICRRAVMLMIIKELTRILMWPRSEEDAV